MALDNTMLNRTTALNPALVEKRKTQQEKAEDVIYTLNHSITCLGVTDTVGLTMAANAYNWLTGSKVKIEHDHNTGYGPLDWIKDRISGKHKDEAYVKAIHHKENHRIEHELEHAKEHMEKDIAAGRKPTIHPDPAHKLTPEASGKDALKKFGNNSKKWLLAEAVGDLGSVPVTIFIQRHAPGFMDWVRKGMEPVIGGSFKKNTHRAAVNWGKSHGKDENSQEVKDYGNKLYEYEMRHMPQMAVWTVSSVVMNFAAMHGFHKLDPRQFEKTTLKEFALVKGLGAALTAGLVVGVRGLTPGGAHKWDQTVGKKVVVPITKTIGGIFGVKSEDVDNFQKKRADINAGDSIPANEVTQTKALNGRVQEQPELTAQVV